jgi:hypothetical protein
MRRSTLLPSLTSPPRIIPVVLTLLLTLPLAACLEREGELAAAPDATRPTGSFARIITLEGLPPQALRPQVSDGDAAAAGTAHRPLAAAAGGGCSCGLRHAQAGGVGRWHLVSEEQRP